MNNSSEFSPSESSPLESETSWTWEVQANHDRADTAILKAMEESQADTPLSRSQLKRLMEEGKVTGNGSPLKANSKLKTGTSVRIEFPPPRPTELVAENRPLDILFEDKHLVVINKPPGLTVHPAPTQMEGTLVHALLHHIKDLSGIGGTLRPGIVHRIDKNTSGALVITKTDAAHAGLAAAFSTHTLERSYWALCYGSPEARAGAPACRIESFIGRNPNDRKKMSMKVKTGKKAISYYRKMEEYSHQNHNPFASWLEVTLETGRTHQVRVHLTGIGHSIMGDPVYGVPTENQPKWRTLPEGVKAAIKTLPGQALHARVLGFEHPITGEKLRFEAKPPESFERLHSALRDYG